MTWLTSVQSHEELFHNPLPDNYIEYLRDKMQHFVALALLVLNHLLSERTPLWLVDHLASFCRKTSEFVKIQPDRHDFKGFSAVQGAQIV